MSGWIGDPAIGSSDMTRLVLFDPVATMAPGPEYLFGTECLQNPSINVASVQYNSGREPDGGAGSANASTS
jgi:hypothetical protein